MPFINDMLQSFEQKRGESVTEVSVETSASSKIVTRFTFDVETVMQHLRSRIVGQDEALHAIEQMLLLVRADVVDPSRPLYVCLFVGPTGVGKTEIVRLLAEAIHGNRDAVCRVDMNTLSQEHYAASLTGAPPGYVGSKEGATILDKEKIEGTFSKPGIVLFDEVEKASNTVLQTLLNVFDNGIMVVASGQSTINFRNSLIFMTSNMGAREIQEYAHRRTQSWLSRWFGLGAALNRHITQSIIERELEKKFSPEFLNRIDEIITFNWIEEHLIQDIISLEIDRLNQRLARHRCTIRLDPSLISHLVRTGFDKRYGARSLKRAIRRYVEVPLAQYLLTRNWSSDMPIETVTATWANGQTLFLPTN
jgi:ATP-dependent Clp protease ATP-binding subunit ClpA